MSTAPLCCENDKKVLIISGQGLWGVNWIDVRQKLVEVQAGAQISYITSKLAEKGLALAHQPSFTEISIAGALQTATHGSYVSGPSLASSVVSLDIFYANSSKATLTREKHGEFFEAAITGLGAIGFLDTVTLRVVPLTNYARADYSLPVEEVVSHQSKIDDLLAKHPHWLSLQLSPLCDNVFVRTASPHVGQDDSSPLQKLISSPWAKHGMRVLQPALRLAAATTGSTTSAIMQGVCAAMSLGASSFVENQSRAVLVSRAAHAQTQAEYYVDRSVIAKALSAVRSALKQAHDDGKFNFNGFLTVSFVAQESGALLAPNFRYNSAAIEITTHHQGSEPLVLAIAEEALKPFEPLPHLGMINSISKDDIKERYGVDRIKSWSRAAYSADSKLSLLSPWKQRYYIDVKPVSFKPKF
jgi:FAD/FMN-containing dehydrogenase